MGRKFCKQCGNQSLHRVAVTVNDDGSMQMHLNPKKVFSKKGLKYSLPAPKGPVFYVNFIKCLCFLYTPKFGF